MNRNASVVPRFIGAGKDRMNAVTTNQTDTLPKKVLHRARFAHA
jgi:hypothetical protein